MFQIVVEYSRDDILIHYHINLSFQFFVNKKAPSPHIQPRVAENRGIQQFGWPGVPDCDAPQAGRANGVLATNPEDGADESPAEEPNVSPKVSMDRHMADEDAVPKDDARRDLARV